MEEERAQFSLLLRKFDNLAQLSAVMQRQLGQPETMENENSSLKTEDYTE